MPPARQISDQEFNAVVRLPAPERYAHTIKEAAGLQELWVLGDEQGLVMVDDGKGREAIAVWPHRRYAEAWGEREDEAPETIDLYVWLEDLTSQLERDGKLVAVFPTPEGAGVVVEPGRFRDDLQAYLDEWF